MADMEEPPIMGDMEEPSHYCVAGLVNFQNSFIKSHPFISLLLCLFGAAGNTLAIYAMTRQHMRSPINTLLASRALVNLFANIIYLPCVFGVVIPKLFNTSNWAINFVPVLDMAAVWLTVASAVWSYVSVFIPQRSRVMCSMHRAIVVVFCACLGCPIICIPLYLTYCVKVYAAHDEGEITGSEESHAHALSFAPPTDLGDVDHKVLIDVVDWVYGVALKIVPCIVVSAIALEIMTTRWKTTRQHRNQTYVKVNTNTETCTPTNTNINTMLVLFLVFTIYELTEGIINIFSFILGESFVYTSHQLFFEILDLLNLLNRNVVFILFCATSVQFRNIVMLILKPKVLSCYRKFLNDPESLTTSFKSS